jgi:nucleotide-binding universal stress UspA family protein
MFEAKVKHILVPVEGASTDQDILRLACAQARRDRSDITMLYVIEVRRALPIDADVGPDLARGETVLEELQHFAHQLSCRVHTDLLQAREAGPAIVSEAIERAVELIVMGVPYREKFGAFSVESRALYVLEHAPCHVLLVREPLKQTAAR